MVEESLHVKLYDKGHDHDMSEPVESVADIQVYEEHLEARSLEFSISEVRDSEVVEPEANQMFESLPEVKDS